jgi:hypothetical protein
VNAKQKVVQVIADIVLYELAHASDGELLSQEADRWVAARPVLSRVVIGLTGAVITLHLGNFLPDYIDLMSKRFWRKIIH